MKNLRDINIIMENSLMSPDMLFQIEHSDKNIIYLDDTDEISESELNSDS